MRTVTIRFSTLNVYEAQRLVPDDFDATDQDAVRGLILEHNLEREEFLDLNEGGLEVESVRVDDPGLQPPTPRARRDKPPVG